MMLLSRFNQIMNTIKYSRISPKNRAKIFIFVIACMAIATVFDSCKDKKEDDNDVQAKEGTGQIVINEEIYPFDQSFVSVSNNSANQPRYFLNFQYNDNKNKKFSIQVVGISFNNFPEKTYTEFFPVDFIYDDIKAMGTGEEPRYNLEMVVEKDESDYVITITGKLDMHKEITPDYYIVELYDFTLTYKGGIGGLTN